jgi:hypothetical protein
VEGVQRIITAGRNIYKNMIMNKLWINPKGVRWFGRRFAKVVFGTHPAGFPAGFPCNTNQSYPNHENDPSPRPAGYPARLL